MISTEKITKMALKFYADKKAQGGLVGYFIGIMIAVIIALQVTWPVIDDVLNGSGKASITNLTGAASTLVKLIPLFFILTLVKNILNVKYNALDRSDSILHTRISVKIQEDKTEASLNNTLERLTRVVLTILKDGYTVWSATINEIAVNTTNGFHKTINVS